MVRGSAVGRKLSVDLGKQDNSSDCQVLAAWNLSTPIVILSEVFNLHPEVKSHPQWPRDKESACSAGDAGDTDGFYLWVRKIPWRRAWQPTPVFLPRESHGQRSLVGYSPWGRRVGHNRSNWACVLEGKNLDHIAQKILSVLLAQTQIPTPLSQDRPVEAPAWCLATLSHGLYCPLLSSSQSTFMPRWHLEKGNSLLDLMLRWSWRICSPTRTEMEMGRSRLRNSNSKTRRQNTMNSKPDTSHLRDTKPSVVAECAPRVRGSLRKEMVSR